MIDERKRSRHDGCGEWKSWQVGLASLISPPAACTTLGLPVGSFKVLVFHRRMNGELQLNRMKVLPLPLL
jgi:hypothetical protein